MRRSDSCRGCSTGCGGTDACNVYLALDHDLDVMPVINKIDLPSADPQRVIEEIEDVIGIEAEDAPQISAKTGLNVEQVLEQIVEKIPAPVGDPKAPLQALIFDSLYDPIRSHRILQNQRRNCKKGHTDPDDGNRSKSRSCGSRIFWCRTVYSV